MIYRLAALVLVGLMAGCGTVASPATQTPSLPRIPTPRSSLAQMVRNTIAPYPSSDWCDRGISRQPIEEYNTSLAKALADLLAAPEAVSLSDSELASIYLDGAQPYMVAFRLVSGGKNVLATLPTYYEYCAMGSHYRPVVTRVVIFDRAGHWNVVKTLHTNDELGHFIFAKGAIQWAGDRWVVMLNDLNTLGFKAFEVDHILKEGDAWVSKMALKAEDNDQSYIAPTMRLDDGYQKITLTHIRYDDAPCTFEANIADRMAWTIYTVDHAYQWDGAVYVPAGDQIVETKVILYAGQHRETYEQLDDWQAHCIR